MADPIKGTFTTTIDVLVVPIKKPEQKPKP